MTTATGTKITEQIDEIEGVEKSYWDFDKAKLTVYFDEKYSSGQMNIRIQDYLARRQLQDSVKEIKFISTEKGTFPPEPKAEKGRAEAQSRYKELMKPRLEAHDREIKVANDDFMAGKLTLKEMNEKHKAINKKTDAVAATMRKKAWGEYPETLPSRAEIEKVQRMRSPRSQASDLAQQHSVVISPDSPKVAMWLHDQGRADISGIDTPRLTKRAPRITPKRPKLRR